MEKELIEYGAKIALGQTIKQPIKEIIDTWVTPKIREIQKSKLTNDNLQLFIDEVFPEYLERIYGYHKSTNILALGNNQIDINEIYIPLYLKNEEEQEFLVDYYDENFINQYERLIIEDSAGMGKSTIMKKLFLSAIEQNSGIPIFIELRKLDKETKIIDQVMADIHSINEVQDKDLVLEMISRGDFIFFFDGYDEISFEDKDIITDNLKQFISKANKNTFIMTSREDNSLSSFGNFKKFNIKKMDIESSYQLIEKYDNFLKMNLSGGIINKIEANLKENVFKDLKSFLGIPFLVSLLYLTYKHKRDVPVKKDQFYRKVYDALFEEHDLSKDGFKRGHSSGLSIDQFHKVLRRLGYITLTDSKNEYTKDRILTLIGKALENPYITGVSPHDVLIDLKNNVPLFVEEGLYFRWTHKSFMEYFAAQFICMDQYKNKEGILLKILQSKDFLLFDNMIDLYFDIDQETFDKVITKALLEEYFSYFGDENSFNSDEGFSLKERLFNKYIYIKIQNEKDDIKSGEGKEDDFDHLESLKKSRLQAAEYIEKLYGEKGFELKSFSTSFSSVRIENGLFVKNRNYDKIMEMLYNKGLPFMRKYKLNRKSSKEKLSKFKDGRFVCTGYDHRIPELSHEEAIEKVECLQNIYLVRERVLLYIDYNEAKKYMEIIRELHEKKEDALLFDML